LPEKNAILKHFQLFGFAALLFIVYLYLYLLQGQCILKKTFL